MRKKLHLYPLKIKEREDERGKGDPFRVSERLNVLFSRRPPDGKRLMDG